MGDQAHCNPFLFPIFIPYQRCTLFFFLHMHPPPVPSSQPQPSRQRQHLDRTRRDERAGGIWKGEVGDGGVQGGESCARVLKIKVQSSNPRAYKT